MSRRSGIKKKIVIPIGMVTFLILLFLGIRFVLGIDANPPTWANQTTNSTTNIINQGQAINLTAQGKDETALDWAWLSTNETGSWVNYTSWPNSTFTKCRNIVIANAGTTTLTNFPAYINLTYNSNILSNYQDLRFYNTSCNNGGSILNYEIENYTANNANIWVAVNLSTGNSTISVYYNNNTAIESGQNPTGVWDNNYIMVQHFKESCSSANCTIDSTRYGNNLTSYNSASITNLFNSSGRVGSSYSFNGTTYSLINNYPSLGITGNITLEYWIKIDDPAQNPDVANKRGGSTDEWQFSWTTSGWQWALNTGSGLSPIYGTTDAVANSWYYFVGTYNTTHMAIYVNGTLNAPITARTGTISTGTSNIYIGKYAGGGYQFNGAVDEFRISNTSRSGGWINQTYQMIQNQAGYVNIGNEQSNYNSPMNMAKNTNWQWSNFTWQNTSVSNGTTVSWKIYYNDTSNNINGTNIMTFCIGDCIPPQWQNQGTNDTDNLINQGQAINLTAQGRDETALDWAWLSTNETGSWMNYTNYTVKSSYFNTDAAPDNSGLPANGYAYAFPVTASNNGTLRNISLNIAGSEAGNMRVALYSAGTGKPANLLVESSSVAMSTTNGWQNVSVPAYSIVSGTKYWVAVQTDVQKTVWYKATVAEARSYYIKTYGAFDSSWQTSTEDTSAQQSMGMGYTVDGAAFYSSPMNMTKDNNWQWSNFTWKNASVSNGATVSWKIYYNDTSNNINGTNINTFCVGTCVDTPPTYSLNSTNSTRAGTPVNHSLYWQDNAGLSGYIFSFDNGTGTLVNDTWSSSFIGGWSNITKIINSTIGSTIRWCVYANDTSNNWNSTSCVNPLSYMTTCIITVCSSGCDSTTVQGGINLANNDCEVRITDSREYNESISINRSIILDSNATSYSTRPTIWNNLTHVINIASSNITISNLIIKQNSSSSNIYGIFNTTSNNNITIFNNSIFTSVGSSNYPIYVKFSSSNISYNNITTSGSGSYGVLLFYSSNSTLSNNNITTSNQNAHGIYLSSSSNNNLTSNNIRTSDSYAYDIYLLSSSNNTIASNNITGSGGWNYGIYLYSSPNSTLYNNNITVSTAVSGGLGLYISGSAASDYIHTIDESNTVNNRPVEYYKYIYNQAIANNDTWATLIVASSNNITITNVTTSPWGMIQGGNLTNSNISFNKLNTTAYYGHGIYLSASSDNILTYNNITTSGFSAYGIYLSSSSNNNTLSNNNIRTIHTTSAYGIYFDFSNKNTFINTNISTGAGTSYDIYIHGNSNEKNYLINCTFNKSDIHSNSPSDNIKLYNQYYLDAYVNGTIGSPINQATVTANDTDSIANTENPNSNFTSSTASSGWITRQIVTEFMTNGTYNTASGYLYFNNYTVNASKVGYSNQSQQLNLTLTNSTTLYFTLQDILPPQWQNQGTNDTDNLINQGSAINLTAQGRDETALDWAWLSTNETGSWVNKTTYGSPMDMNDASNTWTWSNFTWQNSSVADDTIVGWKIYYNDTSNNTNVTDIQTFTVGDFTAPQWQNQGTNDTDNLINQGSAINLTAQGRDETALDWAWLSINESGSWENKTTNQKFEYYNTGDDSGWGSYGQQWMAQTFTPQQEHIIQSVKLKLRRISTVPWEYIVSIKATDANGYPTGNDLCSGSINGNSISTTATWYEINFTQGYHLSRGVKYAIVTMTPSANYTNFIEWWGKGTDSTYSGGITLVTANNGSSWTQYSTSDLMFEEWGLGLYYNSPMNMTKDTNWQWSNFTWQNSSVADDTIVGWKIYYNDTSNNINGTNVMTFNISNPPIITIQSPLNQSYNTNSIWANATLNKTGSKCLAELDSTTNYTMTNSTGNWNYQLTGLAAGNHYVKFYCNSSLNAPNSSDKRYFYVDVTAPQWQNQGENATLINQGQAINLTAQGKDETALDWAWLSTNETGSWMNYTNTPSEINGSWINLTGLVGLWHMNEGSGSYSNDSSGQGNNGTLTNMVQAWNSGWNSTACKFGSCLKFDGVNDYVNVPDSSSLTISGNVTLAAWVYVLSHCSSTHCGIIEHRSANEPMDYGMAIDDSGLRFNYYGGSGWFDTAVGTIPLNTWTFVTVVHDINANMINYYINGSLVSSISGTGQAGNYPNPIKIGRDYYSSTSYFNGTIDDVAIWNRSLSANEIYSLYTQTYPSPMDMNDASNTWTWSNFTWQNSSVADDTIIGWRIYYNDTSNNTNGTNVMAFNVSNPPQITIQSPLNQSYNTNSIWANATLNKTGSKCLAELDSTTNYTMTNSTGNWNYQLTGLAAGNHYVKFYCNSSLNAPNSSDKRYFYVDVTAPQWQNQGTNSTTNIINQGQAINLTAQGKDETALDWAWLSTNETGNWINYTGTYDSSNNRTDIAETGTVGSWGASSGLYTLRDVTTFSSNSNMIRICWNSTTGSTAGFDVSICERSGSTANCVSGTLSSDQTVTGTAAADWECTNYFNYDINSSKTYLVNVHATIDYYKYLSAIQAGTGYYYKINVDDTQSETVSGYTDSTSANSIVIKVESVYPIYNSLMNMTKDNSWQWSNFTWKNTSVSEGSIIGWKIYYNDTSNNTNGTDIMTFRIRDNTPPKWYTNNTNPLSPATYSPNQNYQFNITFNDTFGMSDAILEFNSQNYSYLLGQLSNNGQVYYKTITDLAAGTYNYKWYANDTSNNWNSTSSLVYTINKATPNLMTYIDNATANKTVAYGVTTELRANSTTAILAPTFNFYRNNTLIGTGNASEYITYPIGIYWLKYNTTGNANYSSAENSSLVLSVKDLSSPTYSLNSTNSTLAGTWINHSIYWTDDVGLSGYIFSFCNGSFTNYTTTSSSSLNNSIVSNANFTTAANATGVDWRNATTTIVTCNGNNGGVNYWDSVARVVRVICDRSSGGGSPELYARWTQNFSVNSSMINPTSVTLDFNHTLAAFTSATSSTYNISLTYPNGTVKLLFTNTTGTAKYSLHSSIPIGVGNFTLTGTYNITLAIDAKAGSSGSTVFNFFWDDVQLTFNSSTSSLTGNNYSCSETLLNMTNDTWTAFPTTTTPQWSNVTKIVNSTVGSTIKWCVYANDTSNNWNSTSCVNPFSYVTTTPPKWYSNNTSPLSPATYSQNQNYQFNITWNGSFGMSDVILEFNSQNYSYLLGQLSNSGQVYYKTITDLAAGTYNYKWYANDTSDNWNSTSGLVYVINKATTTIKLYLNGTEWASDQTKEYPNATNINATISIGSLQSLVVLKRNGTTISNPEEILNDIGIYNYTGYYDGNANYTGSSVTRILRIQDTTPPTWQNQGENATQITREQGILLYAQGKDTYKLDYAILETNETGSWQNKTTYSSPMDMNDAANTWTWSNFTWKNTSVAKGTIVGWRIYYNDTSGNMIVTDTMTFTIVNSVPVITNLKEYPTSPVRYQEGQNYQFNITVTDADQTSDISAVIFEWNGSNSTITSYRTINSTSREYYTTITDLAVGTYNYKWYANDTENSWVSISDSYTVTQIQIIIATNSTEVWWGDPINISLIATKESVPIANASVNITINTSANGLVCSQISATDVNGGYWCNFTAPNSVGNYNVTANVYDPSSGSTYSNSTIITVKVFFGETKTGKSSAPSVGCYDVPMLMVNPDGSIKKVNVNVCAWK